MTARKFEQQLAASLDYIRHDHEQELARSCDGKSRPTELNSPRRGWKVVGTSFAQIAPTILGESPHGELRLCWKPAGISVDDLEHERQG